MWTDRRSGLKTKFSLWSICPAEEGVPIRPKANEHVPDGKVLSGSRPTLDVGGLTFDCHLRMYHRFRESAWLIRADAATQTHPRRAGAEHDGYSNIMSLSLDVPSPFPPLVSVPFLPPSCRVSVVYNEDSPPQNVGSFIYPNVINDEPTILRIIKEWMKLEFSDVHYPFDEGIRRDPRIRESIALPVYCYDVSVLVDPCGKMGTLRKNFTSRPHSDSFEHSEYDAQWSDVSETDTQAMSFQFFACAAKDEEYQAIFRELKFTGKIGADPSTCCALHPEVVEKNTYDEGKTMHHVEDYFTNVVKIRSWDATWKKLLRDEVLQEILKQKLPFDAKFLSTFVLNKMTFRVKVKTFSYKLITIPLMKCYVSMGDHRVMLWFDGRNGNIYCTNCTQLYRADAVPRPTTHIGFTNGTTLRKLDQSEYYPENGTFLILPNVPKKSFGWMEMGWFVLRYTGKKPLVLRVWRRLRDKRGLGGINNCLFSGSTRSIRYQADDEGFVLEIASGNPDELHIESHEVFGGRKDLHKNLLDLALD